MSSSSYLMSNASNGGGYLYTDEVPLKVDQYNLALYVNKKSLLPKTCRSIIQARLSAKDLIFKKNNVEQIIPPERKIHMDEYWTPLITDITDEIMTLGVVAIGYDTVKNPYNELPQIIPYVIKEQMGQTYQITVRPLEKRVGKSEFRFYRLRDSKTGYKCFPIFDPNIKIFDGFGYDPMPDGSLTTIAVTILWQERWISRYYYTTLKNERSRSENNLYLESTNTTTAQAADLVDQFLDGDRNKKSTETSYIKNMEEIKIVERAQIEVYEELYKNMSDAQELESQNLMQSGGILFESYATKNDSKWIPLPQNRRVATTPAPSGLQEWNNVNNIYQRFICCAYQVPYSLVFSEGGGRTNEENSNFIKDNFYTVIQGWKHKLTIILNDVYNNIFGDEDKKGSFSRILDKELKKLFPDDDNTSDDDDNNNIDNDDDDDDDDTERAIKRTSKKINWNEKGFSKQKKLKSKTEPFYGEMQAAIGTTTNNNFSDIITETDINRTTATTTTAQKDTANKKQKKKNKKVILDPITKEPSKAVDIVSGSLGLQQLEGYEIDPEFEVLSDRLIERIHRKLTKERIVVEFSTMPNVTMDQLIVMFGLGVIQWETFSQLIKGITNVTQDTNKKTSVDPWAQEIKLSLLRQYGSQSMAKLGIVGQIMFPPVTLSTEEEEDKDKDKDSKTTPAKKKKKPAASPTPDKKRKKEDSGSTDDDNNNNNNNNNKSSTKKPKKKDNDD